MPSSVFSTRRTLLAALATAAVGAAIPAGALARREPALPAAPPPASETRRSAPPGPGLT